MWAGTYSLKLYCENIDAPGSYKSANGGLDLMDDRGHKWDEFTNRRDASSVPLSLSTSGVSRSKRKKVGAGGTAIGRGNSPTIPLARGSVIQNRKGKLNIIESSH